MDDLKILWQVVYIFISDVTFCKDCGWSSHNIDGWRDRFRIWTKVSLVVMLQDLCYSPAWAFPLKFSSALHWGHNDHDGVSNHQPHDCLLNRLFRRRSKKHQSSASLALVWGIHRDRWIPRTNGQLRGKCFHLMTSSWVKATRPLWWLVNNDSYTGLAPWNNKPLPDPMLIQICGKQLYPDEYIGYNYPHMSELQWRFS